jgi:hypothetical protein
MIDGDWVKWYSLVVVGLLGLVMVGNVVRWVMVGL